MVVLKNLAISQRCEACCGDNLLCHASLLALVKSHAQSMLGTPTPRCIAAIIAPVIVLVPQDRTVKTSLTCSEVSASIYLPTLFLVPVTLV